MSKTVSITEIKNVEIKVKKTSRYSGSDFEPVKNGFITSTPSEVPYGYNWALDYVTETVEMRLRKDHKDMF